MNTPALPHRLAACYQLLDALARDSEHVKREGYTVAEYQWFKNKLSSASRLAHLIHKADQQHDDRTHEDAKARLQRGVMAFSKCSSRSLRAVGRTAKPINMKSLFNVSPVTYFAPMSAGFTGPSTALTAKPPARTRCYTKR